MKHINTTNWKGKITDYTKFNYIYGGLDDTLADRVNLCIPGTNLYNYVKKSENLINNSTDVFELGGVSYLPNHPYQDAKDTASPSVANARLRTKKLVNIDPTKTYTVSVPSPYLVIAQGYNNGVGVNVDGTDFNKALSSVTFTGINQVAVIVKYSDNRDFDSVNDIENINIMFTEGTSTTYEPYGSMIMVENVGKTYINSSWSFEAGTYRLYSKVDGMYIQPTRTIPVYMSGYECIDDGSSYNPDWNKVIYNANNESKAWIYITNKAYSSVDEWLANEGNNPIIYPLETPKITVINQE